MGKGETFVTMMSLITSLSIPLICSMNDEMCIKKSI